MAHLNETWPTAPRSGAAALAAACLVDIYPIRITRGSLYPLGDAPLTLGRAEDCDVRINDPFVSRRHARIQPEGGGYLAVDLHSANGTFVNEHKVSAGRLAFGDFLRIGNRVFRFVAADSVEARHFLTCCETVPVGPDPCAQTRSEWPVGMSIRAEALAP